MTVGLAEVPLGEPLFGLALPEPSVPPEPVPPLLPHAATAPSAAVAAVALSTVLREMLPMVSPAVVHPTVRQEKSDIDGYICASMP